MKKTARIFLGVRCKDSKDREDVPRQELLIIEL